jgi:hypothetical protein
MLVKAFLFLLDWRRWQRERWERKSIFHCSPLVGFFSFHLGIAADVDDGSIRWMLVTLYVEFDWQRAIARF